MNSSWISRIQPSSAMTHTARENSSRVWTRLITWKSSYKPNWISPVRANSTTIWFTTITIRFLYTINYTRNSHFRMNKWASLSRMELYLISKKNWTSSLIQWCKIKLKMILDRLLSSKYSTNLGEFSTDIYAGASTKTWSRKWLDYQNVFIQIHFLFIIINNI